MERAGGGEPRDRIVEAVLAFERRLPELLDSEEEREGWRPQELHDFLQNIHVYRAATHRLTFLDRVSQQLQGYSFEAQASAVGCSTDALSMLPPPPSPACGLRPPTPSSSPPISPRLPLSLLPSPQPAVGSHGDSDLQWLRSAAALGTDGGVTTCGLQEFAGLISGEEDAGLVEEALLLFLAIVPASFQGKLSTVPQVAALFRNDCFQLCRLLLPLGSPPGALLHYGLLLQRLGAKILLLQRDVQLQGLLGVLCESDGMGGTNDEKRYQAVQTSLRRVAFEFSRLSSSLEPVLPHALFSQTMAEVLEGLLSHVIAEVQSLDDISEQETNSLVRLLDSFDGCALRIGGPSQGGVFRQLVPSWPKFLKLKRALGSSLAGIMDLYHSGDLEEFSPSELRRLIKALFVETPLRARHLMTLPDD